MDWMRWQLAKDHQSEMLRDAARDRLIRIVVEAHIHGQSRREFYGPALARLGGWLVAWGASLQAHYGEELGAGGVRRKTLVMSRR